MIRPLIVIFVCAVILSHCDANDESQCPENQSWAECGTWCEPSCRISDPVCPAVVCDTPPGCRCDRGYVRNEDTDECIRLSECPCLKGEVILRCGKLCEGTCSAPWESQRCKDTICLENSCGCDLENGWVRCQRKDICVKESRCSCHCN